ncbi:MAG: hypothetical protein J0665_03090 [Deltaproteobacteria bacterium]|jgi:hypothetical protein|nr:hypothetical protein [Deltaproteobacteria bacterium]
MKKEYDFSNAEQGKFYCSPEDLRIPVYIDSAVEIFYSKRAKKRKTDIGTLINAVLKKEMELVRELGV